MEKPWLCSVLLLCTQEAARAICGLWKKCLLNYWGFLDCDDRRSPWWTSRVGPQHDTVMISTSFKSYASLAIFFIISVLFCFFFFFEHETIYTTRVLAVFDFYCRTEACNLTGCENLQNSDSISFTLWGFSSLLTLQYGAWHVYKLCLVLLLLFVDLPLPDFHFQLKKNN